MLASQALFSNSVTSRLAGTEIQGAVTASLLECAFLSRVDGNTVLTSSGFFVQSTLL